MWCVCLCIFKQVVKVHQDTVDTYLEDIILSSIDKTADSQARTEVQELANTINDIAYELEDKWEQTATCLHSYG